MLFRAYPPAMRAKASTVLMIPTVIAPATGYVAAALAIIAAIAAAFICDTDAAGTMKLRATNSRTEATV
jgi:hypothetical protein